MKSLMYHYVREGSEDLPYFRFLHMEDFKLQLDYLQGNFNLISKDTFVQSLKERTPIENGVVLTFDDGLCDHYAVMQELLRRGLWGIFYIATGCYTTKKLLNVHRIHMLLGKYGGSEIYQVLHDILTDDMVIDHDVARFHSMTYKVQENDAATTHVKKILNFSVRDDCKEDILDNLMSRYFENEAAMVERYYLNAHQIKEMHNSGMVIGAHSVSHPVFSKLSYDKQRQEITECFSYLENIVGTFDLKTFCHPYGGDHVFNQDTLNILENEKCVFSFNVKQNDITADDLKNKIQALPRYDCNQFPYGKAAIGLKRPKAFSGNLGRK